MKKPTWLLDFKRDEYSQTGEDGVIEKILQILPNTDKWCVEFGAWDGVFLTNTRRLILSQDYSAVLIEADPKKFEKLKQNYQKFQKKVTPINSFVGFGDDDNLDCILSKTPIPKEFDLLSVDIDGNDYHVWGRVEQYRPKLVVIEFNHTIPSEVRFVQDPDPKINQGASLLSLVELGKLKGYELVCVLRYNAFFVRQEDFSLFEIKQNAPQDLRKENKGITYIFSGYDGKILLSGAKELPWHCVQFSEKHIQILPSYLRTFPANYSFIQRCYLFLFRILKNPQTLLSTSMLNPNKAKKTNLKSQHAVVPNLKAKPVPSLCKFLMRATKPRNSV